MPFLLSCEDNSIEESFIEANTACNTNNPIENLSWFRNKIEEIEKTDLAKFSYISQAEYKGSTIFIENSCCPFCSYIVVIYNFEGEQIGYLGDENFPIEEVPQGDIIWRGSNFSCEI